ncbi:MAG: metal ABC transporter substrate-binding protein [Planctomycetota bacterium]|nr:metal ABC transporter substrate-binding protein [Planctomycetota bacterium]
MTLTLVFLLLGCSGSDTKATPRNEPSGPIVASTWPLTTLARELLGPENPVECLVKAGEDPIHWTPDGDSLATLVHAKAVLINGAGLENWLLSANVAPTRLMRLSDGFEDRWIEYAKDLQHSHGARGAHDHVGVDPHVWMDPLLALEQARALQTQAVDLGWIESDTAKQRGEALEQRLRELDGLWARVATALDGRSMLANHDAYSYPAQRHGLTIHVVDVDPERSMDVKLLAELQAAVQSHAPCCMLFEAEPHASLAAQLQDPLSIPALVLSPAEAPGELDAIESMRSDLNQLLQFLTAKRGQ